MVRISLTSSVTILRHNKSHMRICCCSRQLLTTDSRLDSGADCQCYIWCRLFIDPVGRRLNADSRPSNRRQRTVDSVACRLHVDSWPSNRRQQTINTVARQLTIDSWPSILCKIDGQPSMPTLSVSKSTYSRPSKSTVNVDGR